MRILKAFREGFERGLGRKIGSANVRKLLIGLTILWLSLCVLISAVVLVSSLIFDVSTGAGMDLLLSTAVLLLMLRIYDEEKRK